jgi:hypothetical protein
MTAVWAAQTGPLSARPAAVHEGVRSTVAQFLLRTALRWGARSPALPQARVTGTRSGIGGQRGLTIVDPMAGVGTLLLEVSGERAAVLRLFGCLSCPRAPPRGRTTSSSAATATWTRCVVGAVVSGRD